MLYDPQKDHRAQMAEDPPDDFISTFFTYTAATSNRQSPDIFRLWGGIALLAAALERRIWLRTGDWITFPNLYTLFVGPSGVGKNVIDSIREILRAVNEPNTKIKAFKVAPDNMTKASMIDALVRARSTKLTPKGQTITYHALTITSEEFSVFMSKYDMDFVGVLNRLYNNPAEHEEERRFGIKEARAEFPMLNILGGIQPAFLAVLPDETWTTGLGRRFIMLYSSEVKNLDPFIEGEGSPEMHRVILAGLSRASTLFGELRWDPKSSHQFREWALGGETPRPTHSRLAGYVTNRRQNMMKLMTISAISRHILRGGGPMTLPQVSGIDFERAMRWLIEAEGVMPDIFRAMVGKNDWQLVEETWLFLIKAYEHNKRAPVHHSLINQFIAERTTSEKVGQVFNLMEKTNAMHCVDDIKGLWMPRPKEARTLE